MSAVTSSSVGPSKKKPGARGRLLSRTWCPWLTPLVFAVLSATSVGQTHEFASPGPKPADVPPDWKKWVGEYVGPGNSYTVGENSKEIVVYEYVSLLENGEYRLLERIPITGAPLNLPRNIPVHFEVGSFDDRILISGGTRHSQRSYGVNHENPAAQKKRVEELRKEALASTPPVEQHEFRKPDLVELTTLDPAIHLNIRYATANDFLGAPVYTQVRAFLQRPAAEALLRVLQKLKPLGYGLLIHDGYRPWYVTKIFWDATPPEGKIFVADPAQGSRHNRGCAVDLTLYDLKTGQPIEMTGGYDEMSPRSFPNYPGGTSLQRWHRDLLRHAMESEGFTVYESEWWHFDYKDWHEYGILNIPFEKLGIGSPAK